VALKKKVNESVKTPWKSFPADVISQSIQDFVHFSAKLTNSNSPAAGIRLSADQRLDLPYLSVRTLGSDKVPLDYTKNVGSVATIAKKLKAVEQNEVDELYTDIQEQDISHFKKCIAATITHHEIGTAEVGKRLRQVIVQDAEGKDVALTPLVSAGLTALLEKRIQQEIATRNPEEYRFRSRAFLPIGGSNPQNVGRFVRSLQRPLWFSAPEENLDLRQALAIHYQGISLQVSSLTLVEYDAWRRVSMYSHGNMITRSTKNIETEVTYLRKMVDTLVQRARQAHQLLEKHLDDLPNGEMLANLVPPDVRAFIDERQRYAGWNRVLAKRIHGGLLEKKFEVDGISRTIGLGEQESDRWVAIIEGFL
jgi:hypothetical protein